ncbi:MAG TPA: GNAT family N-acetyltransferase [Longimicrobiales bacterium]|nr:GNAT family N-acetyltransferase [Longimicrobiales bacterium]
MRENESGGREPHGEASEEAEGSEGSETNEGGGGSESAERPQVQVTHNEGLRRFEAHVEGQLAKLDYEMDGPDRIIFTHTNVPPELEGRGVGSALARSAVEHARDQDLEIVAQCPFVQAWLERHPEYAGD